MWDRVSYISYLLFYSIINISMVCFILILHQRNQEHSVHVFVYVCAYMYMLYLYVCVHVCMCICV